MTNSPALRAAQAFVADDPALRVEPFGQGLINDTFLVTASDGRRLILQRLSRKAFPQPERVQANLRALLAHVATRQQGDQRQLKLPGTHPTRDGADSWTDSDGGFWRALEYIGHTRTLTRLNNPLQAGEVGFALGRFHALVCDLDPGRLQITREGFHQTPMYYERFWTAASSITGNPDADGIEATTYASLHSGPRLHPGVEARAAGQGWPGGGLAELRFCLDFATARAGIVDALESARRAGRLPVRVIHGDPKLDNLLFDESGRRVVALIDLDTAQPGLVHYDLGDCLRSACNPAGESPTDPREAHFDLDLCRAILKGYFDETRGFLTREELHLLPVATRLIPFELGLRFLTDHLNGDRYFKVAYRGHNLLRAATQFRLAESIEGNLDRISALVAELARS
ncbi:MAG: aminoglycoside phosphotransferase family protein [Pseudomonadota bacterium]